ncbi:PREDICTED: probable protein phosphatase 2C 76 [Nelumbo nucifera]|uniref:protein-serine/threonine phosphatase n=1 Tax=Nelumbo nucifera TaxID=4432 RepID=A0A1U8QB47_NELNU|nr:PREDICTED: probable protein phosphatase 2C 76 [Nelumbo nucifera]
MLRCQRLVENVCVFGIFDGHGGSRAVEFLKEHLFENNLMRNPRFMTDTKLAISESYKETDMDFLEAESNTCKDDDSTTSVAVISEAGKTIPLSKDHKSNRTDDRKRIKSTGGVVMWTRTWRVGGVLAMS